jgi:hypothetical protein
MFFLYSLKIKKVHNNKAQINEDPIVFDRNNIQITNFI